LFSAWVNTSRLVQSTYPMRTEAASLEPSGKKDGGGGSPGSAGTLSGNRSGRKALRRKQREQLGSNHRDNRVTLEEGETDLRRHKHSPWKRRNGGTPVGYSGPTALMGEQCGMLTRY
jgi:hypothetical protein